MKRLMLTHLAKPAMGLAIGVAVAGCGAESEGAEVGEKLTNYQWRGYVNETAEGTSTDHPISDYSIAALTQSGPRFALIHLAAVF